MLDHLPNEILVEILEKTKLKTSQKCRLLSSRFNKIIERDELHKEDLGYISIYSQTNYEHCVMFEDRIFEWDYKLSNFDQVIDLLAQEIRKFRRVFSLRLENITINHRMLQLLLGANCLKHLSSIEIQECKLNTTYLARMWAKFLTRPKNARICIHQGYGRSFASYRNLDKENNIRKWKNSVRRISSQMSKLGKSFPICTNTREQICKATIKEKMAEYIPKGARKRVPQYSCTQMTKRKRL